jgi:hypothetical protein
VEQISYAFERAPKRRVPPHPGRSVTASLCYRVSAKVRKALLAYRRRKPHTLYEMKTSIFTIMLLLAVNAGGQTKNTEPNVKEIIQKFGATESQNKMARAKYAFVQDLTVQTIGPTGAVTGEIRRISEITYDKDGKRIEKIITSRVPP